MSIKGSVLIEVRGLLMVYLSSPSFFSSDDAEQLVNPVIKTGDLEAVIEESNKWKN